MLAMQNPCMTEYFLYLTFFLDILFLMLGSKQKPDLKLNIQFCLGNSLRQFLYLVTARSNTGFNWAQFDILGLNSSNKRAKHILHNNLTINNYINLETKMFFMPIIPI